MSLTTLNLEGVENVRGEMKKSFVVNNNLSLGFNTKTKTSIKSLIIQLRSPSIPAQSQRSEENSMRNVECQRPTLRSFGSGNFLFHTNLEEVAR